MYETKTEIGRYDLQRNIMKYVLFRIDYIGIANTMDLYNVFTSNFSDKFASFSTSQQNKYDIQINDLESVSESLTIPIKEIQKEEIFKFTHNTFGTDELTLNITRFFSTLQIKCTNYHTIDEYLAFFSEMIGEFKNKLKFFNIKRIGLRKVGGNAFLATEQNVIYEYFNKELFSFATNIQGSTLINGRHFDAIAYNDTSIVNIIRLFEKGRINNDDAIQITLDLDGYLTGERLEERNAKKILTDINDKLFDIFKQHMTDEFLNEYLNEK
ncbi:TIGR04255 family protein [Bacteroides thetaiotaomicron]|nr:TIGR04255 family protein [Bacteroides thetaiotaomicron]